MVNPYGQIVTAERRGIKAADTSQSRQIAVSNRTVSFTKALKQKRLHELEAADFI